MAIASQVSIDGFFSNEESDSIRSAHPLPMYHQLYCVLKDRIVAGRIGLGHKLPGEAKIADALGVSRITVSRSLDMMVKEGLIRRQRGIGSYVTYRRTAPEKTETLAGSLRVDRSNSHFPNCCVLHMEIRSLFGCPVHKYFDRTIDENALYVVRLRSNELGQPLVFQESWTCGFASCPRKSDFESLSRIEVLRKNGLYITHATQSVRAEQVSSDAAPKLLLERCATALTLLRRSYNRSGRIVDVLKSQYNPHRTEFNMTLDQSELIQQC